MDLGSGRDGFRADIEGLRAVAVGLVVLNHLIGQPSGGFIGVDVFFVISGFLITSLLLAETERTGRLSYRGFYARRARRILPGALTVLLAVVIAAHIVFRGARIAQTISDVWWALGFAANVHFARVGVDYFQADRAPSLVQHFWSLAVEEQFYLVWPLVIVVVLSVIGRRLAVRRARALLLAVVVLASAASFAYSLVQTRESATAAYFSSPARAWELGAGALIAVAAGPCRRWAARLGRVRGPVWLLGLAGVIVSAFVVSSAPGFPAPWAALPVASAALLIAAGLPGPVGRWGVALTNPISRYLGRISYSLYLWHWPVIVVALALIPDAPGYRYPIGVLALVGLSIASYHLIEAPCRNLRRGRRVTFGRIRRPALAAATCLLVAAGLTGFIPPRSVPAFSAAPANAGQPLPAQGLAPSPPDLAAAIDAALSATHFPTAFTPSLARQGTARTAWGACDGAGPQELAKCTFGSTAPDAKVAVVIGDSIAMSWLPGIETALGGAWRVVGLTLEACPAADIAVRDTNGRYDTACDTHHAWAVREATELHPQLVVLSSSADTLERLADNSTGAAASAEYETALHQTIDRLAPSTTRRIVILSPPPTAGALAQCDTQGAAPADCVRFVSNHWIALAAAEQAAAASTGTSYVDTRLWFCNSTGFCPAFIGSVAIRWDADHLTDVYAHSLANQLRAILRVS